MSHTPLNATETPHYLEEDDPDGVRSRPLLSSTDRIEVLKQSGHLSKRPFYMNPKVWMFVVGLLIVIGAMTAIITFSVMHQMKGRNAKYVERLVKASETSTIGYNRLGYMLDTFGSRISGSQSLNDALAWMRDTMIQEDGFTSRLEPVTVGHWVRGNESLDLVLPHQRSMAMLGLGGSVGTPAEGITADVLVVDSFAELDRVQSQVPGKIIVFNAAWNGSYSNTVVYRSKGASRAAQYGAVACLVRSVTPFSLQTPHTGAVNYDPAQPKIPAAAITVEDATFFRRVQNRGTPIRVTLYMEAHRLPNVTSYNIIGELPGSHYPSQYVVMGGHIDSWDVGQGAHDDAGGVFAAWEALRLIKASGLVPRRTIRVVGWVDEEQGGAGANQYALDHAGELPNTLAAMESDSGTFRPVEMLFTGTDSGFVNVKTMAKMYLTKYLAVGVGKSPYTDADISPLARKGVPAFSLRNEHSRDKYFYYHHTQADTFDKIDKTDFNLNAATFAVLAWVFADHEFALK